jgi:hypothetical protein
MHYFKISTRSAKVPSCVSIYFHLLSVLVYAYLLRINFFVTVLILYQVVFTSCNIKPITTWSKVSKHLKLAKSGMLISHQISLYYSVVSHDWEGVSVTCCLLPWQHRFNQCLNSCFNQFSSALVVFLRERISLRENCEYCYIIPLNLHLNNNCFWNFRN